MYFPKIPQFEDAVRMAIGHDPPFPPSVIQMTTMPHEFKWLRINSRNEGNYLLIFYMIYRTSSFQLIFD